MLRLTQKSIQKVSLANSVALSQMAFASMIGAVQTPRLSLLSQPIRNFAYHKNVLDHYENPRNVGSLDKKDPNVGTGLVGAPACGDVMKLQIKVNE